MSVVQAGIIIEGALLTGGALWIWCRSLSVPLQFTYSACIVGIACTLPTLLAGWILEKVSQGNSRAGREFDRFQREFIDPLCRSMDLPSALALSIIAGAAEELAFRIIAFQEFSLWIGAVAAAALQAFIFAWIHFGPLAKEFPRTLLVYTGFGLYLQAVLIETDNFVSVMLVHALHNSITIMRIKLRLKGSP